MNARFALTLVVTHACDLACTYCSAGPKSSRRLDEALGRRAIERALRSIEGWSAFDPVLDLGFFGGEPLLEWPLVRKLAAFARKNAAEAGVELGLQLTTNGTRVTPGVARELVEDGFDVGLSIDGLPEVHDAERRSPGGQGSAARALAALERLLGAGAGPSIVSVVRPSNVAWLAEGARFLVERGARDLRPSLDWRASWTEPDAELLAWAVGELGALRLERTDVSISWIDSKLAVLAGLLARPAACGFGTREVAVAPSGNLYPCERLVEDDRGQWAFGRVQDGDGAYPRPRFERCTPAPRPKCEGCSARFACSSSCACANLARTGHPDRPDGLVCALEQASLDAARAVAEGLAARAGSRAGAVA